jgi:hypothetical protein
MPNSPSPPPSGHKPILSNRSSPPSPSGSFEFCEVCGWQGCKWA